MQNLKSLNNLLSKPVLGANDDTNGMVGRPMVQLYDHAQVHRDEVRKMAESQRSLLSHQELMTSNQD